MRRYRLPVAQRREVARDAGDYARRGHRTLLAAACLWPGPLLDQRVERRSIRVGTRLPQCRLQRVDGVSCNLAIDVAKQEMRRSQQRDRRTAQES